MELWLVRFSSFVSSSFFFYTRLVEIIKTASEWCLNQRRWRLLVNNGSCWLILLTTWCQSWIMLLLENSSQSLVPGLALWSVDKIFRRWTTLIVCCLCANIAFFFFILFFLILNKILMALDAIKDFVTLPLSPHEVVVTPFFKVTHTPPKSCF